MKRWKKLKRLKKPNVPTFGWLEAYKEKKIEREPARLKREIERFEALLDDTK